MMAQVDKVISYIVVVLGVLFTALTPIFVRFPSPDGVLFIGTTLFFLFLGLLNLARIKSQHRSAKILSILANVIAAIYLVAAYIIVRDPTTFVAIVPVLGLCFTSWQNPKIDPQHIKQ